MFSRTRSLNWVIKFNFFRWWDNLVSRRVTYVIVTWHKYWNRSYFGKKSAVKSSIQNSQMFSLLLLFLWGNGQCYLQLIYLCILDILTHFRLWKHSATNDILCRIHLHSSVKINYVLWILVILRYLQRWLHKLCVIEIKRKRCCLNDALIGF